MDAFIDIPPPTIPPCTQSIGPAHPQSQSQSTFVMVNSPEVSPVQWQPPADYRDAEAQQGTFLGCSTECILIRVPAENYGDSSGRLWMMYMTEAEKDSKQTTENWNAEADRILLFVRALPSIFYIYSKAHCQDWSFFHCRCVLRYCKLSEPIP